MKSLLLFIALLYGSSLIAQSPQEGWAFQIKPDPFDTTALLDLRYLNEEVAGENGFVQLSADGESFVTERGGPIRFWATGGGNKARRMNALEFAHHARFLAKKGVNMVRFHGEIHSVTDDIFETNKDELDAIWKMVAIFKQEGIYSTISPFWPHFIDTIPPSWGLGDYSGSKIKPWGLLYFNDRFQEAYKSWLTDLYTIPNPYTGIPLKDDPAVGLIQMLNEDGVFFWTISSAIQPSLRRTMEHQFHEWVIAKYSNLDAAYSAWETDARHEADAPEDQRLGIYHIYEATLDKPEANGARLADQMAFFSDVQGGFYQEVYDHLREIGCKQLINCTNWKTANNTRLLDLERHTNTVAEVMAVNRYYSAGHEGPYKGWRYQAGDYYQGESVLYQPHKLPVNVKQVEGHPFTMTESSWPLPHRYVAESVFLTSAYASLSGFDTYYWFSPRSATYSEGSELFFTFDEQFEEGNYPVFKFNISTPAYLTPFPANALLYRKGYVQEAPVVVREHRILQDMHQRKAPLLTEESGFDPNRDLRDQAVLSQGTSVNPLAYLSGKVRVVYGSDQNDYVAPKLEEWIDYKAQSVTSATGELIWDYGKGQCQLDAPAAQGVAGFLTEDNGTFRTQDLVIQSGNSYATILTVSMDGLPLASTQKALVQINTLYELTGHKERPATYELGKEEVEGYEILQTGSLPWKAAATRVTLTINNPNLSTAMLLDENGYAVRELSTRQVSGGLQVTLPEEALYVILK
ncbi:hypothetical protein [Phaeodactylibacter xiamenensis]|uniref:hypothetical protein n=1 Tax=Phaeodactylibacter xiamenensis TaxID=1524460 RepID=UPI0024A84288|nr:hypothetical protein [Phaeodactylibacter xiamenensis]